MFVKFPFYTALSINWMTVTVVGLLGLGVYTMWRALTPSKRCRHCGSNHYAALSSPLGQELSKEWEERRSGNEDSD